jgi:hypothetical protein
VIAIALRIGRNRSPNDAWGRPALLVVVAPAVVTLVLWLLSAPDPRFALPAIWLPVLVALAWSLRGARLPVGRATGVTLVAAVLVVIAVGRVGVDAILPIAPHRGGRLGIEQPRRPKLIPWNVAGVDLGRPEGSDQCWGEIDCTAYDPTGIARRGDTLQSGYSRR